MKNLILLLGAVVAFSFSAAYAQSEKSISDDEKRQSGEYTDYGDAYASGGKQGADHHGLPSNCHCDLNNTGSQVIGGTTPFTGPSLKPVGSGLTVQETRDSEPKGTK